MKFNIGAKVKITSGIHWLDEDLKPSQYKPKEKNIGMVGIVVRTTVRNNEEVCVIKIDYEKLFISVKYLELCKEMDDYDSWKRKNQLIKIGYMESGCFKKEREGENMNKNIVLMWTQKMKEGYSKCKDAKISELKNNDTLYIKKKELEKTMLEAMEYENINIDVIQPLIVFKNQSTTETFNNPTVCEIISRTTRRAIKETVDLYNEKIKSIEEKSVEVITMIEGCETYDKTIEVLRAYNIVDDKGRLLLPSSFELK